MKKQEEQKTEYSLAKSWRLRELPTVDGVAKLVEQVIINTEQARELLFSNPKEKKTEEENAALKEQIKFLQDLVDRLIDQRRNVITTAPYTYTIKTPSKHWDNLTVWGSASGVLQCKATNDNRLTMSIE